MFWNKSIPSKDISQMFSVSFDTPNVRNTRRLIYHWKISHVRTRLSRKLVRKRIVSNPKHRFRTATFPKTDYRMMSCCKHFKMTNLVAALGLVLADVLKVVDNTLHKKLFRESLRTNIGSGTRRENGPLNVPQTLPSAVFLGRIFRGKCGGLSVQFSLCAWEPRKACAEAHMTKALTKTEPQTKTMRVIEIYISRLDM